MIRAALFDFGGVFTASPFEALRSTSDELGIDRREALALVFGSYDQDTDHPWHKVERGEMTMDDYRGAVVEEASARGLTIDPWDVLAKLSGGGGGGSTVREDVIEVVRVVRGRGVQTALVTNNVAEFREMWRALIPVEELFDTVVDSSEVGLRKPDPAIFHLTLEQLGGVEPVEAVFLDDYPGNVKAAQQLGMHAILVENDHQPAMEALHALLEG